MLAPVPIPGLFVTGTDTEVGKTVVAGLIADWFRRRAYRTAVLKPAATGCVRRREGLVSEDAEFLARCADARHPLDLICPQRYAEPLAPAVAARRAGQPLDWAAIDRSVRLMAADSDVMVVEGVGGVMVPMDDAAGGTASGSGGHTVLDIARWLRLPAVIVARPGLGTLNHTLLTIHALRGAGVRVAGVVVNRFRTDGATVAEETNPAAIERWGKTKVLAVLPDRPLHDGSLPPDLVAVAGAVEWSRFTEPDALID